MKPQLDFIAAHMIQHNNASIEWSPAFPDQSWTAKSWLMHKIAPHILFMSPPVFTPIYKNYPKPALLNYKGPCKKNSPGFNSSKSMRNMKAWVAFWSPVCGNPIFVRTGSLIKPQQKNMDWCGLSFRDGRGVTGFGTLPPPPCCELRKEEVSDPPHVSTNLR
jgi:hypothetical protein